MADKLTLPIHGELPQLRWDTVVPAEWTFDYDKATDTFCILHRKPQAAISIDVQGIWVRMNASTGSVVGLEIEDFEKVFLAKQPELANAWKQLHSRRTPAAQKETWYAALLQFLRAMLGNGPPPGQPRLQPAH